MQGRANQPPMSPSSSLPSPATAPSSSSNSTRNSKLDHIIQNFYTKTAQLIIQARLTSDRKQSSNRERRRDSKKLNKWFNIATEDIDILRDELKYWRTLAIQALDEEPPPMIIDIYLDTSRLTQTQALMVIDDNLRRNRVDLGASQTDTAYGVQRILIETWVLTLNHPLPDFPVDLPNLYKRSIVFFRSLHSLVRLLPAYNLHRRLRKFNDGRDLSIGYQFSPRNIRRYDEIPLDASILDGDARNPTKSYTFTDIMTPLGTFKLQVNYRRSCDFKVEDSERDISARFVDMDEQFFTPTIAKYQQDFHTPPKQRPASMYDTRSSVLTEMAQLGDPPMVSPSTSTSTGSRYSLNTTTDYSDPREIVQQRHRHSNVFPRQSPLSSSLLNREAKGSSAAEPVISSSPSVSRRTSIPAFSPFKSPSLSSSPQAENMLSGFKNTTSSEKSKSTGGPESSSSSFGKKIEFSSSFDKYKGSPSRIDTSGGTSMTRRWSRNSDHSSINLFSEMDDTDLEDFVRFVGVRQELKLFQGRTSASNTPPSSSQLIENIHQSQSSPTSESGSSMGASGYGTGSIYKSKKALSHFQNLRETHNTLSDSVTSSVMALGMGGASNGRGGDAQDSGVQEQRSEPMAIMSGVSPGSSSSSTGRSYQPVIPSPLHAEQRSVSPVRIPRSLPPPINQGAISPSSTSHHDGNSSPSPASSSSRHRRYHSTQQTQQGTYTGSESDTRRSYHVLDSQRQLGHPSQQRQPVAFSSYPQDRHHNDLRRFNMIDQEDSSDSYDKNRQILGSHHSEESLHSSRAADVTGLRGYTINRGSVIGAKSEDGSNGAIRSTASAAEASSAGVAISGLTSTISNPNALGNNSGSGGGVGSGARTSILDDDDSLVFKMSELGGEPTMESNASPITSPILFNRPAITGSSQTMFTTKRLLETSQPLHDSTNTGLRRTNSSDNINLQQQLQKPYQPYGNNSNATETKSGSDSPSASSCKSEPTPDASKHLNYFGGW